MPNTRDKMCSARRTKLTLMKLTLVCVCASFALQIVGFLSPFWLGVKIDASNMSATNYSMNVTEHYFSEKDSENFINEVETFDFVNESSADRRWYSISRHYSLWFVITCVDLNCSYEDDAGWDDVTLKTEYEYDHGFNFSWIDSRVPVARQKEFLIEAILAITLLFVAMIQVWHHKRLYQHDVSGLITGRSHSRRHFASIVSVAVSAGLISIPFREYAQANTSFMEFIRQEETIVNGTFTKFINHEEDNITKTIYNQISVGVPYSVTFSGSGLILSLLVCMFLVLTMYLGRGGRISRQNNDISLNVRHYESSAYQSTANASNVRCVGNQLELQVPSDLPPEAELTGGRTIESSPYANLSNDRYCNEAEIDEDPPPPYEEAVRLYVKTDG